MIEFFNEYAKSEYVVAVVGLLLIIGITGWFVWCLVNRIGDRDICIVAHYHKKRDPQIKSIVRTIMAICRCYTLDAPYVMKYFTRRIESEIASDQFMLRNRDGFWELSINIDYMIDIVREACGKNSPQMSEISGALSIVVASYNDEGLVNVGQFTDIFFSKSQEMIRNLEISENALITKLASLQILADEGWCAQQSSAEVRPSDTKMEEPVKIEV